MVPVVELLQESPIVVTVQVKTVVVVTLTVGVPDIVTIPDRTL